MIPLTAMVTVNAASNPAQGLSSKARPPSRPMNQQGDARIGAARGGDAKRDDGGLAGQHREDRVQGGNEDRDRVRDYGIDLQAGEDGHLSSSRSGSWSGSWRSGREARCERNRETQTVASTTAKMIHGAATIRSTAVIRFTP
jgi:hypothetical protein